MERKNFRTGPCNKKKTPPGEPDGVKDEERLVNQTVGRI